MNFTITKAEMVYTGGGIYVFAGITADGHHFLASNEPEWVMLTDAPTMTDEMDDETWENMFYPEWMEAHAIYETQTYEEARKMLLILLGWLELNNSGRWLTSDIEHMREVIINEMNEEEEL